MSTFRLTYCDPWIKNIQELGYFSSEQVMLEFEKIQWAKELEKVENPGRKAVQYSPSFGIQDQQNKRALELSLVGPLNNPSWMIFYIRPGKVKTWFGFREKQVDEYLTEISDQTQQDTEDCIKAFIQKNYLFLEEKVK